MHLPAVALFPAVLLGGFLASQFLRLLVWTWRGGSRVVVPWNEAHLPQFPVLAQRRRTRDGSFLSVRGTNSCQLLLWKLPRGPIGLSPLLADAVTGWTGIWSVAVDCSLESKGEPWVITSGEFRLGEIRLSGPHYAPLAACPGSALARIDISPYIDASRLLVDLRNSIANPAIRHNGARETLDFLLGRVREDRVNCSGLAGRAILKQPSSPMAKALRQAMRDRFTWGDVTPSDLARAAAILGLAPDGASIPIRAVPVLRQASGSPILNRLTNSSKAHL
ncbi:MAG: hypothetical protein ABSH05_07880 [Bryobacteraceae bacterium]